MSPRRPLQPALVAVGATTLAAAAAFALLRLVPPSDDATVLVASFIPYGLVAALIALVCLGIALVRARRRGVLAVLTLLAAALLGAQVTWQAPLFVVDGRPALPPDFTLLSLNTYKGEADPAEIIDAGTRADVVVLVEITPALLAALRERGWLDQFPYNAGVGRSSVTNSAVFSRYPLSGSRRIREGSFDEWVTTVSVPRVGEVGLVGVHVCNPYCGGDRWAFGHELLGEVVQENLDGPLVVAGDFNAVDDHGPMQQLRRLGLRSATDLVGGGFLPTYPANRLVPPLLPIDHVLVDDRLTVTSLRRVPIAGTDHLGLVATIARSG